MHKNIIKMEISSQKNKKKGLKVVKMNKEKIIKLVDLLEELENKEFWNNENILNWLDDDTNGLELDIATTCEFLINHLQKNYICNNIKAWSIKK